MATVVVFCPKQIPRMTLWDSRRRLTTESIGDGVAWMTKDGLAGVDVAWRGWDGEMAPYPYVSWPQRNLHMVHNGSGLGRSGRNYAILPPSDGK
jgi:hypothetical protein